MAQELIFVTGGTGFLGRHLVPHLLSEGFSMRLLVRPSADTTWLPAGAVELVQGDVTDEKAVRQGVVGSDYVVHAAGLFRFWGPPNAFMRVNRDGTENICAAALDAKVRRFLYISTIAVIGNPKRGEIIDEQTLPRPQDGYQRSKVAAEKVVQGYVAKGLPAMILRPGAFYGPGGRYGFNRLFVEEPMRGWRVKVYGGKLHTFPAFVPDAARAIPLALRHGRVGEIYNIADSPVTHNEVNRIVSSLLEISPRRINVPRPLLILLAAAMEAASFMTRREPYYPLSLRHYVFNDWRVHSGKAREELAFQPTPIEEGLRQTVEWFVARQRRG